MGKQGGPQKEEGALPVEREAQWVYRIIAVNHGWRREGRLREG